MPRQQLASAVLQHGAGCGSTCQVDGHGLRRSSRRMHGCRHPPVCQAQTFTNELQHLHRQRYQELSPARRLPGAALPAAPPPEPRPPPAAGSLAGGVGAPGPSPERPLCLLARLGGILCRAAGRLAGADWAEGGGGSALGLALAEMGLQAVSSSKKRPRAKANKI